MTATDRIRLDALNRTKRGELTGVQAAELMGVLLRQARRLWKRFQGEGTKGLLHRLRGCPGNRRLSEETRERAVKLHQEKYQDFGPTLACEKLLEDGVALSPDTLTALLKERGLWQRRRRQAKGRVERRNAVFQDRLVKEMRLRGISNMAQGNELLEKEFLDDLNRRYAIKPVDEQDLHRAIDAGIQLEEVLCVQEERVVGQDWCVRWKNRWLQISNQHGSLRLAKRRVLVKHLANGSLVLLYKGQKLSFQELHAKPEPSKQRKPFVNNKRYKPSKNHPWDREPASSQRPATRASVPPAQTLPAPAKKTG